MSELALLRQRIPHWEVCRRLTSEIEPRQQLFLNWFLVFLLLLLVIVVWSYRLNWKACAALDHSTKNADVNDNLTKGQQPTKKKKKKKSHKENPCNTHTTNSENQQVDGSIGKGTIRVGWR
jgi:cytoskeletal protein RodZ